MNVFFPAVLILVSCGTLAGADQFPALQAEDLNGKKVNVPAMLEGRQSLLIVGFTRASTEQTKDWAKRIPKDVADPWSVAVLEDAPRLMRRMVARGIRSDVPKARRAHFLVVYQNEKELKAAAQFQAPDEAYLIVVAPDGSIHWRFHGAFTHTAFKQLRDQLHADPTHGMRQ